MKLNCFRINVSWSVVENCFEKLINDNEIATRTECSCKSKST